MHKAWWILTMFDDSAAGLAHAPFADLLDHQLSQFSLISRLMPSAQSPHWWLTEPFAPDAEIPENEQIEKFLYNPLARRENEEFPRIGGRIDANFLHIAVVGDARSAATRRYLPLLGAVLNQQKSEKFGTLTIKPTAFIYLPCNINQLEEKEEIRRFLTKINYLMNRNPAERGFKRVVWLQDKNASPLNRAGFTALSDVQTLEMMTQVIFSQVVSDSREINEIAAAQQTPHFSVGAASVFYDWQKHQDLLAGEVERELLDHFRFLANVEETASSGIFSDRGQAENAVSALKRLTDIKTLFRKMVLRENRPSFVFDAKIWEAAKDNRNEMRSPRRISDWFSTALYKFYFLIYLRRLPRRLREYARIFLAFHLREFENFLEDGAEKIWNSEDGLKKAVEKPVIEVLRGEHGNAQTLRQINLVLENARRQFDFKKLHQNLPNREELEKLKIFVVPADVAEGFEKASFDSREFSVQENEILQNLSELLRFQPLPLALLMRVVLVGILLTLTAGGVLQKISPFFINLEFLKSVPYLFETGVFILTLLGAYFWYYTKKIKPFRKLLREYIGLILFAGQQSASRAVERRMSELGERAQKYCDELKENLRSVSEKLVFSRTIRESYRSTTFHRNLFEALEIPGRGNPKNILQKQTASTQQFPDAECRLNGTKVLFQQATDEQKLALIRSWLASVAAGNQPRKLGDILSEAILTKSLKKAENPDETLDFPQLETIGEISEKFCCRIYEDVSEKRLTDWLADEKEEKRREIFAVWQNLASPPIELFSGVSALPISYFWSYDDEKQLDRFSLSGSRKDLPNGAVFMLTAIQPVEKITDIHTVRLLGEIEDKTAEDEFEKLLRNEKSADITGKNRRKI